jgi:hypothetical protein
MCNVRIGVVSCRVGERVMCTFECLVSLVEMLRGNLVRAREAKTMAIVNDTFPTVFNNQLW